MKKLIRILFPSIVQESYEKGFNYALSLTDEQVKEAKQILKSMYEK